MKTLFVGVLFVLFGLVCRGQQDTSLVNRVNQMLKLTQMKDLEKIMDFTYPKLFEIVPRDMLITTMKETYDTEEFFIELDSMRILTMSPVFVISDTSYVKVKHSMLMRMKFKEPADTSDKDGNNMLVSILAQKYGEGNVRYDVKANSLNILMKPDMVGIKDKISNTWTFANLNDGNPAMLEMLFSKAVREKLKEYN